jgi:hypothetical protein
MGRRIQRSLFFALLLAFALPARAADPVLMLLMSVARGVIESAARRRAAQPAPALPAPVQIYPGTTVLPEQVRRMIDESFGYLAESQRREIFDSVHATLTDPKTAGMRAPLIEYFADRAHAVREAQTRLALLTQREKAALASDFRRTVATLTDEEVAQFAHLLRQGLLPIPADLNEMLLAALRG